MADVFPHRFSTKYYDAETDLYYYGYRYYSPSLGRWISRDPIEEEGGLLLYGFCLNSQIYAIDSLGQKVGVILVGDSLTFGVPERFNGYSKFLFQKIKGLGETVSIGEHGLTAEKISDKMFEKERELFCPNDKVAVLCLIGMNNALAVHRDRSLPQEKREENWNKRYQSGIDYWELIYHRVKNDLEESPGQPNVLFLSIAIPEIKSSSKMNGAYPKAIADINKMIRQYNKYYETAGTSEPPWWTYELFPTGFLRHFDDMKHGTDDGVHFLDGEYQRLADRIAKRVNEWSREN